MASHHTLSVINTNPVGSSPSLLSQNELHSTFHHGRHSMVSTTTPSELENFDARSSTTSFDIDILANTVSTAIHKATSDYSPVSGSSSGTTGGNFSFSKAPPLTARGKRDENSTDGGTIRLIQLYDDIEKYYNLTAQAKSMCSSDKEPDEDAYSFAQGYKRIHGYIAFCVCIFGTLANMFIMVVLTRKEMRTPVNMMLFWLAIADLFIMVEHIPFALHMYILNRPPDEKYSYGSALFVFFHVHFTQILHTISIQLTLSMAIWRFATIKYSTRSATMCTMRRCWQVIIAAYICPFILCILNYLYFKIERKTMYITNGPKPFNEIAEGDDEKLKIFENVCSYLKMDYCDRKKVDLYFVESSDLVKDYPILHKIHFWTFSVLIKLIPCVVLTFFMCWLVNTLYKARRHHKMLENKSALPLSPIANAPNNISPTKSTMIHPEQRKSKLASPSKNIRFESSTDHCITNGGAHDQYGKLDQAKVSLLGVNGTINGQMENSLHPSPIPPQSLVISGGEGGGDSRRPSGGSDTTAPRGEHNGGRRFTRGFIRFPSIRRPSADQGGKSKSSKSCKRTDRTSKMLIAVLLLFLLTEFPQGIMHVFTGWYGPEFLRCYYNPWAEVWDILALINSAINFILYCFMSKQFRNQFHDSFKLHLCFKRPKWITIPSCNNNATVSTTV